jgi:pentatricopeptide repeat protein
LESALSLLDDMYLSNRHPDVVTYTVVVDALGKKGKLREATELVEKMLNRGLLPTPVTYRTVIHRYCERGEVEELLSLLDKMLARQACSSAYNQVIEKLCAFGKLNEAYNLLSKILRTASKGDAETCKILMESSLNRGITIQAYHVACRMFQRNLIPDIKLCRKVDSQLVVEGQTQAAGKLIIKFVERGLLKTEERDS